MSNSFTIEEIEDSASRTQKDGDAEVLRDFSRKIARGVTLTDRQSTFLKKMIERSKVDIKHVEITDDIHSYISLLRNKVMYGTSAYYWSSRQATYNRAVQIFDFYFKTGKIDEVDFDYLKSIFKGFTESWNEVETWAGKIFYLSGCGTPVLVLGKCLNHESSSYICVNVLSNGASVVVPAQRLLKRKQKLKK